MKPHLSLDGDNLMPYDAYLSTGNVHDVHGMDGLCGESGVIHVLDRGYIDYKSLYTIELPGSTFVTRMKSTGAYKRIENNPHEKGGAIIPDVLIQLTGSKTKKRYPRPIRKNKYYDAEYRHPYEFITNNMEMGAREIAGIYKRRRQVELFFKRIKQHLKIKSFWGTGENAVFSQIWAALIIAVLLWICKTIDGVPASAHQIMQMVKNNAACQRLYSGIMYEQAAAS